MSITIIDAHSPQVKKVDGKEYYIHMGDLGIAGDAYVRVPLVVLGKLTVNGNLDAVLGLRVDDNLRVDGNVTARWGLQARNISVAGDVKADSITCDDTSARSIVADGHVSVNFDLSVKDSLTARGDIFVGGDLKAGALVESTGRIIVHWAIKTKTEGLLKAKEGIFAGRGIECGELLITGDYGDPSVIVGQMSVDDGNAPPEYKRVVCNSTNAERIVGELCLRKKVTSTKLERVETKE